VVGRPGSPGESLYGVLGCICVPAALVRLVGLGCASGFGVCVVVGEASECVVGRGWRHAEGGVYCRHWSVRQVYSLGACSRYLRAGGSKSGVVAAL
jgi:hypothetical protein